MSSSSLRIGHYADQSLTMPSYEYSGEKPNGGVNFKRMDVTVSVLGLTGIMVEDKGKKKVPKIGKKVKRGSLSASTSSNSTDDDDRDFGPVKAVVTFFKSVNKKTAIASHLPSLPLRPLPSGENSFIATWPTDFDPLGNELSTFKFTRMMQIEEEARHKYRASHLPLFVPERVQLTIGLNRGSEMITIGTTTLVVTGDEAQDVQVNLPLRLVEFDNTKLTSKSKKKQGKLIKPTGFSNDPNRKYILHANSCLKVLVRASPSERELTKPDMNISMSNGQAIVPEMTMLSSQSLSSSSEEMKSHPYQYTSQQHSYGHVESMHSNPYSNSRPPSYHYGPHETLHNKHMHSNEYEYDQRNFHDAIEEHADDNSRHSSFVEDTTYYTDEYTDDNYTDENTDEDTDEYTDDETADTRKNNSFQLSSLFNGCGGNMSMKMCMFSPSSKSDSMPMSSKYRDLSKKMFESSNFLQSMRWNGGDNTSPSHSSRKSRGRSKGKSRSYDDMSVATEKIKNFGGQGYGMTINQTEGNNELGSARQAIKDYAARNGVNPTMMI